MRIILALICWALAASAQTYFSVPPPDAPELAARGKFSVGVRTLQLTNKAQIDILNFNQETGKAPLYDRPLTVELWYPATIPAGKNEATAYTSPLPTAGRTFELPGKALRDAPPLPDQTFPLVIVSHGYPGSRTFLTYLTENLASKGYIVAAIDHTDSVVGAVKPFQSTLLNRTRDQLFVLHEITALFPAQVQFNNAAIVGYSMGGYGALTSAGAELNPASALQKLLPGGYLKDVHGEPAALKAIVAIAPWGRQPPTEAWDAAGLTKITLPSLFIAGDQDDVADYERGIKPAFEQAVNSDRYLLTYLNARHNTGGNPPLPGVDLSFAERGFFEEPVWNKGRINAINQHFITAFLDLHLKGDTAKRAYLDVPMPESGQGKWVPVQGEPTNAYSKGETFWKGFQRRSALGLRITHLSPK